MRLQLGLEFLQPSHSALHLDRVVTLGLGLTCRMLFFASVTHLSASSDAFFSLSLTHTLSRNTSERIERVKQTGRQTAAWISVILRRKTKCEAEDLSFVLLPSPFSARPRAP